jgi:hypothetical protein
MTDFLLQESWGQKSHDWEHPDFVGAQATPLPIYLQIRDAPDVEEIKQIPGRDFDAIS